MYYLQSRYYDPQVCRFINADAFVSTGQGLLGNNMFAYCLNCPIMGVDLFGTRTYFINGISNRNKEGPPEYANAFEDELENAGLDDVIPIAVYNGLSGCLGNIVGGLMVFGEMLNIDVYTNFIVEYILNDIENNPLAEGEQLNIIGYSGGGQLALNVMEKLDGKVDNVILIGAPVLEISITTTNISYLYSESDIFSWKPIFGIRIYDVGPLGHEDYFKQAHIGDIAEIVAGIIK